MDLCSQRSSKDSTKSPIDLVPISHTIYSLHYHGNALVKGLKSALFLQNCVL